MGTITLLIALAVAAFAIYTGIVSAKARAKRSLRGRGFADELPYRALVTSDAIKLVNGGYLAAWEIDAPSASGMTDQQVSDISIRLARAYNPHLDSRCVVHFRESYLPLKEYDRPSTYRHPALRWLDMLRAAYFARGMTYTTRRVLTVAVLPDKSRLSKIAAAAEVGERDESDVTWVDFETKCADIERSVGAICRMTRLGRYRDTDAAGRERGYNALIEYIDSCVTGLRRRIVEPPLGSAINGLISLPFRGGFDLRVGDKETQVVVVKQFPYNTHDLAFERLRDLAVTYDLVVRFLPEEAAQSRKTLNMAREDWEREASMGNNRLYAAQMMQSVDEATLAVEEGAVRFGKASVCVIVRSNVVADAREGAKRIAAALTDIGYPSHVASLTAEDDYFASWPGNSWAGVRKHPLHTLNLAHVFSTHASSRGRRYVESPTVPAKTPALAYVRAIDGVSRRVNLNGEDPPDTFGCIGVGGMGRGKSHTLAELAWHWLARMPNAAVVVIEKGRSSIRPCAWLDGSYIEPLSERDDALGLALFAKIEEPEERRFVAELMRDCCTLKGLRMNPHIEAAIDTAMEMMLQLDPKDRNLTAFVKLLQDPTGEYRQALQRYTKSGPLGRTLDESVDTIKLSRWVSVELGPLLRSDDAALHTIVIKALLFRLRAMYRRMRERGQPDLHVFFFIDEAYSIIRTAEGAKFVSEMRREARKDQLGIGLFSQQIEHFSESPIAHELRDIPVSFWWGNPAIKSDTSGRLRRLYEEFGCSSEGVDRVSEMSGYLFGIADRATGAFDVVDWVADKATLAVMGRSRPADHALLAHVREQYPDTWREVLLEREGVAAESIAALRSCYERFRQDGEGEVA